VENQIDKKLLISYFSGNATAEQKRQITLWLDSNPDQEDFFYQCLEEWERENQETSFNSNEDFESLTARINASDISDAQETKQAIDKSGSNHTRTATAGRQFLQRPLRQIKLNLNKWQKIAATAIVLSGLSVLVFTWYSNRFTTYTACGKIKEIMLPDSSTVILNARSEIRYLTGWDHDAPREVWLEGEAFFSVTHTPVRQPFIVHTSGQVDVEVLGTQFNVSQRANRTRVVLNAGEIRLQIKNGSNDPAVKHIAMKPGDLVEFAKSAGQPVKKTVNPQVYSSWKNNRLFFDNTTLPELINLLEERYERKVVVTDNSLTGIRFNGDFPSDNLQLLLKALAATYNLEVTASTHEIYLESGNNRN